MDFKYIFVYKTEVMYWVATVQTWIWKQNQLTFIKYAKATEAEGHMHIKSYKNIYYKVSSHELNHRP